MSVRVVSDGRRDPLPTPPLPVGRRLRYSHRCRILQQLDATMERTARGRRSRRFLPWFARLVWCIEGGEVAQSRNTLKAWLKRHQRTCPLHDYATTAP